MDGEEGIGELEELKTGLSFGVEYLGYVPVYQSLKQIEPNARERLTNYCMYLVGERLRMVNNHQTDRTFAQILGDVVVERKNITLNMALYAFILMDDNDCIMERHPTDVISYASFAKESCLRSVFCFVSNPSELKGRRCLVFKGSDESIDFIYKTLNKVFKTNNGPFQNAPARPSLSSPTPLAPGYVNTSEVTSLPAVRGLSQQSYFHGYIERPAAEAKLQNEGDFLVRMSRNTLNNVVLSGIANSVPKHFLLLDEQDQKVRKQSQVFETIVELIEFHLRKKIPIISEGSELHLIRPIENDAAGRARRFEDEPLFTTQRL